MQLYNRTYFLIIDKKLYSILIKSILIIVAVNCSVWRKILGAVAKKDVYFFFFLPIKLSRILKNKTKNPQANRSLMIWIFQKLLMRLNQIQMWNFLSSDWDFLVKIWMLEMFPGTLQHTISFKGINVMGVCRCKGEGGGVWSKWVDRQEVGVSWQTDRQTDSFCLLKWWEILCVKQ